LENSSEQTAIQACEQDSWNDCTVRGKEFAWLAAARKIRLARHPPESLQKLEAQTPTTAGAAQPSRHTAETCKFEISSSTTSKTDNNGEALNPSVGLAFSGGGVRSATYNLGVLQGLAEYGVLEKVGFISSVSGGSYINAWLAHWMYHDGFHHANDTLADHSQLISRSTEPCEAACSREAKSSDPSDAGRYRAQRPISHLRDFSSYLTPSRGLFSADVWSAAAAYVLRLAPNMLFVVSLLAALLVLPYNIRDLYRWTGTDDQHCGQRISGHPPIRDSKCN
jgi:hypothetical protein